MINGMVTGYTFHGLTSMYIQKGWNVLVFPTVDDMRTYISHKPGTPIKLVTVTKPGNYNLYFEHMDVPAPLHYKGCKWMFQIVKPFTHPEYGRIGVWGFWYYYV